MRLIIYNGKGGVGKTSVSTATALRLAKLGHRTILMSVDTAHSIGDALDMKLGPEPTNVAPNLDVLELDIVHEMKTKWSAIKDYISAFMLSQGIEGISADELAIFPGMEMVSALLYVLTFEREGKYDVVIIDTAPTGETLRLMSFPDVSNWYIDKMFSIVSKLMGVARFTVGHIVDFPLPSKKVMNQIKVLKDQMKDVKRILEDSKNTTVRLVLNPERMAINETRRSYAYMSLYNKNVECLVINKVIPDDADGAFIKEKLKEQREHMEEIHSSFDPLKIMTAYMMKTEMRGTEKLEALADMIFGDSDPIEVYSDASPMSFTTLEDGTVELRIKMPFVDSDEVELFKGNENTIILHVGSQKRTVSLPMTLSDSELLGAEFGDECLIIKFRRPDSNE
ncbi:arsenite-activated ATPase (arsA) [Thermoplasmatales archaeon BRNA1]|nr:arsenite-activated ATPase (arsA) [Thermoplasmatales archaeon BRNA1]